MKQSVAYYQTTRPLRIFLSYYRPHIHLFLLDMFCALLICLIDLAFPYLSRTALNELLHQYAPYIIGRMGIPYRQKKINILSVALDAPQDTISALAGKLGNLKGVSVKTAYSNVLADE